MFYQSLIVFLNRRCPVGCTTCNAAALPENDEQLSSRWLSQFFERMKNLNFSGYIVWTGGEPFLSYEALTAGISFANSKGYHSEVLTSGIWFDQYPERLELPVKQGYLSVRLSLDAEHQENVPISRIIRLISRAEKLGVEINFTLREIPGNTRPAGKYIEDIKEALPEYYQKNVKRSRWIHHIPHMPITPSDYDRQMETGAEIPASNQKRTCKLIFRDLVIGADGLVYPCCGLFSLPFYRRLAVGDPLKESWETIVSGQTLKPEYEIMRTGAPCHRCLSLLASANNGR
jgi:MoaA/NifB/PqqE/SkfB family radical SAM enzyme